LNAKYVLAAMLAVPAAAQTLLPARPGVILYLEGRAMLDADPVAVSPPRWPQMRPNAVLRTDDGRAKVLLNPCLLLHLGNHSALRMVMNSLTDARVELLAGSAVVDADGGNRTGSVELEVQGNSVRIARDGLYRFDSSPAQIRVYYGVAAVKGTGRLTLAAGHALLFGRASARSFDRKQTDAFDEWSDRRVRQLMDDSRIPPKFGRPRICVP
jgi:hypothetical protein